MATQRPPTPISPSKPTQNSNTPSQVTLLNIATIASQNGDTALAKYICKLLLADSDLAWFQKADCFMVMASTSKDLSDRITYLEKCIQQFEIYKTFQGGGAIQATGNLLKGLKETLRSCKELEKLKMSFGEFDDEDKENVVPEKKETGGARRQAKRRKR